MRIFKDKNLSFLTLNAILILLSSTAQFTGCAIIDLAEDLELSCDEGLITLQADILEFGLTTEYVVESIEYAPSYLFDQGTAIFVGEYNVWCDTVTLLFPLWFIM